MLEVDAWRTDPLRLWPVRVQLVAFCYSEGCRWETLAVAVVSAVSAGVLRSLCVLELSLPFRD